jgi:peptidoglycan/LPS O-acetylase OafA/YrhL
MKSNTAAAMAFFGLLLVFGAVGGMDDPAKADYFVEQCLAAIVGLGLMFCGVLGLENSDHYD